MSVIRAKISIPKPYLSDLLLPVAIALWIAGVLRTNTTNLGSSGLLASLPVTFYLGLCLLLISCAVQLQRSVPSQWRLGVHSIALVFMLYGTAALVYTDGRYAWLYKTVGVVQYVNAHGQLNHNIDIYQNWPGFFAVAAWFDKIADVASPLTYAKWAQPFFELAAVPLLYVIFASLDLTVRQRWIAIVLYLSSNWIAQDYFSPQALGTLLSLGLFAVVCQFLLFGRRPRRRRAETAASESGSRTRRDISRNELATAAALVIATFFVLTFTHELTPYVVVIQLGVLAIVRLLRPRWLPIVLGAVAVGYLIPRFTFVNDKYGLLDSIGNFFGNAAVTPSTVTIVNKPFFIKRAAEVLSIGMWLLAIAGMWLRRRSGRPVLALAVLVISPALVLFAVAYGTEGTLRVFLYSLPWCAALASCVLAPDTVQLAESRGPRSSWGTQLIRSEAAHAFSIRRAQLTQYLSRLTRPACDFIARKPYSRIVIWSATFVVIAGLFLPSFYGYDNVYVMTPAEVSTVTAFFQKAVPGPVYLAIANAPVADTARYNLFPEYAIFGADGVITVDDPLASNFATAVEQAAVGYTGGSEPSYVIVTPSMYAFNETYPTAPKYGLAKLLRQLLHSPEWRLVTRQGGCTIYELPGTIVHLKKRHKL